MKKYLLAILLLFPIASHAITAGPGCEFGWDYTEPLPANVDGFRFYLDDVMVWEGSTKTVTCATVGVATEKEYQAYVTAYNDAAESLPSNTLVFTYVNAAPAETPTNLRFLN